MAYKIAHAVWLATETARVKQIILAPRFWRHAWNARSLHNALNEIGLNYTLPEIIEINDELHAQGVVEDIVEPAPPG